jgi:site-specific recombinase XerD
VINKVTVRQITPHLLPHTFVYSYLENNQKDLVDLAKILGHDSVETTQIYTQKRVAVWKALSKTSNFTEPLLPSGAEPDRPRCG